MSSLELMPCSICMEKSCHKNDGRLVVEPDCQRKTLWVAWSVQLMLMSSINVIGNSFLIKTDNFFFFPSRTDRSGNLSHNHWFHWNFSALSSTFNPFWFYMNPIKCPNSRMWTKDFNKLSFDISIMFQIWNERRCEIINFPKKMWHLTQFQPFLQKS